MITIQKRHPQIPPHIHQKMRKGCRNDYLEAFGAVYWAKSCFKKSWELQQPPFGVRGLKIRVLHTARLWGYLLHIHSDLLRYNTLNPNAAVNGHLELPLLKDRQRFDAVSTSNLEVLKFRDWWILTYFIFGHGESSLNNFWSMVNLERTCVLLFYYFLCLKANLDLEKTNQLGESSPNFIFAMVNLDLIILEKRWIDGESWPNDFVEKVNGGEDLRWVGSRWPLTHA